MRFTKTIFRNGLNLRNYSYDNPQEYYNNLPDTASLRISVFDTGPLELIEEIEGGYDYDNFCYSELSSFDDAGRYMVVPAYVNPIPPYSLRVIDTLDNTVEFDLSFPLWPGKPAGLQYAHLVPGQDILWAVVSGGQLSESDTRKLMLRLDTITHDYDFFPVDEATDFLGDFAIAPDGNTLYLTVVSTGEVIVWNPYEPNAVITVMSPNGGEGYQIGSNQSIIWSCTPSYPDISPFLIEYYNGSDWVPLGTASGYNFSWIVPPPPTNSALIKVSSIAFPEIYDESDDYFSVYY